MKTIILIVCFIINGSVIYSTQQQRGTDWLSPLPDVKSAKEYRIERLISKIDEMDVNPDSSQFKTWPYGFKHLYPNMGKLLEQEGADAVLDYLAKHDVGELSDRKLKLLGWIFYRAKGGFAGSILLYAKAREQGMHPARSELLKAIAAMIPHSKKLVPKDKKPDEPLLKDFRTQFRTVDTGERYRRSTRTSKGAIRSSASDFDDFDEEEK